MTSCENTYWNHFAYLNQEDISWDFKSSPYLENLLFEIVSICLFIAKFTAKFEPTDIPHFHIIEYCSMMFGLHFVIRPSRRRNDSDRSSPIRTSGESQSTSPPFHRREPPSDPWVSHLVFGDRPRMPLVRRRRGHRCGVEGGSATEREERRATSGLIEVEPGRTDGDELIVSYGVLEQMCPRSIELCHSFDAAQAV